MLAGESHPATHTADAAALTIGERKAYRIGYMHGLSDGARQLELFRIKVAAKGVVVDVPAYWPTRGA